MWPSRYLFLSSLEAQMASTGIVPHLWWLQSGRSSSSQTYSSLQSVRTLWLSLHQPSWKEAWSLSMDFNQLTLNFSFLYFQNHLSTMRRHPCLQWPNQSSCLQWPNQSSCPNSPSLVPYQPILCYSSLLCHPSLDPCLPNPCFPSHHLYCPSFPSLLSRRKQLQELQSKVWFISFGQVNNYKPSWQLLTNH